MAQLHILSQLRLSVLRSRKFAKNNDVHKLSFEPVNPSMGSLTYGASKQLVRSPLAPAIGSHKLEQTQFDDAVTSSCV